MIKKGNVVYHCSSRESSVPPETLLRSRGSAVALDHNFLGKKYEAVCFSYFKNTTFTIMVVIIII